MNKHISTKDVEIDLGINQRTVRNYCRTGYLPAIKQKNGSYKIEYSSYLEWREKHFAGVSYGQASKYTARDQELTKHDIRELIPEWLEWCASGKLTGKPLSPRTVEIYEFYFDYFINGLPRHPQKPIFSTNNIRLILGSYPPESYSTKQKIYDSIMSFTKFLIEKEKFTEEKREALKKLRPKRFLPAKRTSLSEAQIACVIDHLDTYPKYNSYDLLTLKTIFVFLVETGLRAQELCSLKLEDVDIEAKVAYIWLGKGNKNRQVGLNEAVINQLRLYLNERLKLKSNNFFITKCGNRVTRKALTQRISRLANRVGLDFTCHSLRRSFVTINAGKGKPLNHLRIACGHSDLSTTQNYCMTSVDEVVEAMKNW